MGTGPLPRIDQQWTYGSHNLVESLMTEEITDTHPDAEKVQLRLLREATVARRVALVRSLTQLAVSKSKRAIRRTNPSLSQREQDVLFVELNYGKDLTDRVKERLQP